MYEVFSTINVVDKPNQILIRNWLHNEIVYQTIILNSISHPRLQLLRTNESDIILQDGRLF